MARPARDSEFDRFLLDSDGESEFSSEAEASDDSQGLYSAGDSYSDLDEAQLQAPLDSPNDSDSEFDDVAYDPLKMYNPLWRTDTAGLRDIPFTKENKLLVPAPGTNTPYDWWNLLVDDTILENIVRLTNQYAWEVFLSPNLKPQSRIHRWKELTVPELKRFIGLILHMGTVRINRINDYWRTDRMFNFGFIREQMARDRFLIILRCLHFSRTDVEPPPNDRLFKIRMLIDYFNDKMKAIYYPGRELSLDEGTTLWRGRLLFRQYISGKCHKYGIKLYSLCEPDGLCLGFTVNYYGQGGEFSGKGHAGKVAMHLMREKLGVGHILYMDNYYVSFPLAAQLLANDTHCTGTLLPNRKFLPEEVKSAKLNVGEKIERFAEGVMVAKWRDERHVLYLSTAFTNDWVISHNRFGQPHEKPLPIVQYNGHMKGVDRHDQLMSYYPCERKTVRWYKKIFVHLLQMMMVNAFKMYAMANPRKKPNLYDFRIAVVDKVLPPKVDTPPPRPRQRYSVRHVLSSSNRRDSKGNRFIRQRCRECAKQRKKTMTVYVCAQCPGEPGLCALACFDKWHSP